MTPQRRTPGDFVPTSLPRTRPAHVGVPTPSPVYSTCLFCNTTLGANAAIEHFPVGRRLAFDPARGRLWVVCRQCERWNLTPLEERWEAIEECERAFRETRLRVSTDEIGLARLREGLELVRIGEPQRPEMAAWRYGDQFGRRRRRSMLIGGGVALALGTYAILGPVMGLVVTVGAGGTGILNLANLGRTVYRARSVAGRVPASDGRTLVVQRDQLEEAALVWERSVDRWSLAITHRPAAAGTAPWWHLDNRRDTTELTGDDALRAARQLLPALNASGGSARIVREAVDYLGDAPTPESLFAGAARSLGRRQRYAAAGNHVLLRSLPATVRLALEMSVHEDVERRALEGELHLLENAWRDAEEIAAIADRMFLPASVDEQLERLRRQAE